MMGIRTFKGGIHPLEGENGKQVTAQSPVVSAAAPQQVAIMLSQHIGAPATPLVNVGDRVLLYQKIGEPEGAVGAPIHASVSGKVLGIRRRIGALGAPVQAIVIDNDGLDEPFETQPKDPFAMDKKQLAAAIREAGIVGLGGAAFPTAVKLMPPIEKPIDTLIVNGAECEPYLTCDHRLMLESPDAVVDGLLIAKRILGAHRICIGIESNKADAIAQIKREASGKDIEVIALPAKYPQGGEKQLIQALTGREVPSGKLPMDVGCVVINVATTAAISGAIRTGKPIVERIVTVTGAVDAPKNLRVRIGTPIGELIEQCGGLRPNVNKVLLGGPMMGNAALNLETPVVKATSGLLLMEDKKLPRESNCIRCARCASACPIRLLPMQLHILTQKERIDEANAYRAMDCIECGCCSYVCPAKLPLVQSIRVAKREITRRNAGGLR